MEIYACLYFSFLAVITLSFLKLGFDALDRTDLSTSVSPVVMFVFKHAFAVAVCHSSDHTLFQSKKVSFEDDRHHICTLVLLVMHASIGGSIIIYLHIYYVAYFIEIYRSVVFPSFEDGIDLTADFLLKAIMMCFGRGRTEFIPMLAVLIGGYTSAVCAAVSDKERPYELLTVVDQEMENNTRIKKRGKLVQFGVRVVEAVLLRSENQSTWRRILLKDRKKFIEFAIGMVGTVLFQNFFRLTSFDHILAFLYLAVSWLGNISLLRASGDLGVFNFLLGNVIVGCTVSQFGLHGTTWIAFGASMLLYGLRLKLECMALEDRGERGRVIVL